MSLQSTNSVGLLQNQPVGEDAQVDVGHDPLRCPMVDRFDVEQALHRSERSFCPPYVPISAHQFLGRKLQLIGHQHVFPVEPFLCLRLSAIDPQTTGILG